MVLAIQSTPVVLYFKVMLVYFLFLNYSQIIFTDRITTVIGCGGQPII